MRLLALVLAASLGYAESAEIQRLLDESRAQTGLQHFDAAIRLTGQAIDLSRAQNDPGALANSYIQLSLDYFYARKLPAAVDAARQAETLATRAGDHSILARAIGNEANALRDEGKLEEARERYEKQLAYIRAAGDRRQEAILLRMTALLYRRMGDHRQSIANGEHALRLAREIHDRDQEAASLFVLGVMEREQHRNAQAVEHLNAALEMPATTDQMRVQILQSLGTAYCDLKQFDKCMPIMRRQLDMAVASGVPNQIAWGRLKLAYAEGAMGAHSAAYADGLEAVRALRSWDHDPYDEAMFLAQVGGELVALGRAGEAIPYFEQGIALVEELRQGLVPSEDALAQAASAGGTKELFDAAIDAEFSLNPAQAFHTGELRRARAFLSVLSDSKVDLRRGLAESDRAREEAIFRRIAAIQKQLWQPGLATAAARQKNAQLEEAENALDSFRLEMRKANPRLADIRYPRPLTVDEARRVLKPGVTLIEYSLGEQRSYVWALSRERFTSQALPAASEIAAQVEAFRKLLTAQVSGLTVQAGERETAACAARLYRTLLKPVEDALGGGGKLVIVPDGVLHYVPFEALYTSGAYLLERFPIAYAASATSFLSSEVQPSGADSGKLLLAFGDPAYGPGEVRTPDHLPLARLPYTRAEVNAIAALFPRDLRSIHLGADAREQTVATEALDGYRYIHFATHGLFDEAHPNRSGLALAADPDDDGVLRVDAIAALRLHADVVTLSACNTGRGRLVSGEGMLGLVRAFLYAGAASVNVSLWDANDAATAQLMQAFYRNLRSSEPAEQALRSAKLALMHGQDSLWRHPHYWSPFVLWLP